MSSNSPARASFLVTLLFAVGVGTGAGTGWAAAARAQDPYLHLERFADVLTRIEAHYVDEVSSEQLVDAAIRGMIRELDEHSRWLSTEEARDLEDDTDGSYEGIGVEVRASDTGFTIARVLPNGPAQYAGLAAGDLILAVDGEPMTGRSLQDLSARLKGPRGESVTLSVLREGWVDPQEIPTVRDRIHTPSVEGERFDDIVYVRLAQFQKGASADLQARIRELDGKGVRGLVLDLRDNPGGLLEEAVAVSDLFLDDGVIVSTRGRSEGPVVYSATYGGVRPELPVAVLVNGMSASAAEIVGGALQDTGRAVLIGERTYGKGSVQTLYSYPDQSALKLTIAHYYTPSGAPVAAHEGRVPDVEVLLERSATVEDQLVDRIAALDLDESERKELLALTARLPDVDPAEPVIPWDVHGAPRLEVDAPLAEAITLLRGR